MENEQSIDPRIRRSRQMIQQAFMSLMMEQPFSKISVGDISERADVNRSTFYKHYMDKYDLFHYAIREKFQEELEQTLPVQTEFCHEGIIPMIIATCQFMGRFNRVCSSKDRQLDIIVETQVQSQLYDYILGWLHSLGGLSQQWPIAPETAAAVISWTVFGAGMEWRKNPDKQSPEEVAQQVFMFISQGMLRQMEAQHTAEN